MTHFLILDDVASILVTFLLNQLLTVALTNRLTSGLTVGLISQSRMNICEVRYGARGARASSVRERGTSETDMSFAMSRRLKSCLHVCLHANVLLGEEHLQEC